MTASRRAPPGQGAGGEGEDGQRQPPQGELGVGERDVAGAAEQGAVEAAPGHAARPVRAHAALGGAGEVQPGADPAPACVRLRDPLGAAHGEPAGHGERGRRSPPGRDDRARREQGQGEPYAVGEAEAGGGRDHGAQAEQGPPPRRGVCGTQEPADGRHRGQGHPQVGHGLRPVEQGGPQAGEQQRGQGRPPRAQQRLPDAVGRVQGGGGQQRQDDPEHRGGVGDGEDRGGQKADAARARGAEVRRRAVRVDLGEVHRLVPARPQMRDHEGELGRRIGEGDQRGPRDPAWRADDRTRSDHAVSAPVPSRPSSSRPMATR